MVDHGELIDREIRKNRKDGNPLTLGITSSWLRDHQDNLFGPENRVQAAVEPGMKLPAAGLNLDGLIKGLIIQALKLSNGNRTRAARFLGISRPTLIYRLEKYGIEP